MSLDKVKIEEKVLESLEQLRPFLHADGGDIEFVGLRDDGVVEIRLLGACVGCGFADVTVTQGIEQSLVEEVPGIIGVQLIQDNW